MSRRYSANRRSTNVCSPLIERHLPLNILVVRALAAALLPGLHIIEVITIIDVQDELVRDVLLDLRRLVVAHKVELGVLGKIRQQGRQTSNISRDAYAVWRDFVWRYRYARVDEQQGSIVALGKVVRQERVDLALHGPQHGACQARVFVLSSG